MVTLTQTKTRTLSLTSTFTLTLALTPTPTFTLTLYTLALTVHARPGLTYVDLDGLAECIDVLRGVQHGSAPHGALKVSKQVRKASKEISK